MKWWIWVAAAALLGVVFLGAFILGSKNISTNTASPPGTTGATGNAGTAGNTGAAGSAGTTGNTGTGSAAITQAPTTQSPVTTATVPPVTLTPIRQWYDSNVGIFGSVLNAVSLFDGSASLYANDQDTSWIGAACQSIETQIEQAKNTPTIPDASAEADFQSETTYLVTGYNTICTGAPLEWGLIEEAQNSLHDSVNKLDDAEGIVVNIMTQQAG